MGDEYSSYLKGTQAACAGYQTDYDATIKWGVVEVTLCDLGKALRQKCNALLEFDDTVIELTQIGGIRNTERDREREWEAVIRIKCMISVYEQFSVFSESEQDRCMQD